MTDITGSNAGMAASETGDTYRTVELFSGDTPLPTTEDFPVPSGVTFAEFSVVGLSGGNLVLANTSGPIKPLGVTVGEVLDVGAAQRAPIYRTGCFNPAALTWHADYSTDAAKAAAFRDAESPTDIIIRKFA